MFQKKELKTKGYTLSYEHYASDREYLFVFHGFGQSAAHFHALNERLQAYYSIISIDLFFHGSSSYAAGNKEYISINDWSELLKQLILCHSIKRFNVLGFSIGGRFAISALYAFHKNIDRIILIASDGLLSNFWYRLATGTALSRVIFKYIVLHPQFIVQISNLLVHLKLMDNRIIKFAHNQMQTVDQCKQVYRSWIYFRKLKMPISMFIECVQQNGITLKMIFGTKDRIVQERSFKKIIQQTGARVALLDTTHSRLAAALAQDKIIAFLTNTLQKR